MREIIRASAFSGFIDLVADLGGDPDQMLAAVHLDRAALIEADRYIPLRAFIDCQEIAATRLNRPDFGLMLGARQDMSMLGALAIAMTNGATARESLEIGSRYFHLHNPVFHFTITPIPGTANDFLGIEIAVSRPEHSRQNAERAMASLHKSLGQIAGAAYHPADVWFPHKPLAALAAYRRAFGVAPRFEQPLMGIAVSRAALDATQSGRSPQLLRVAEDFMNAAVPARDTTFILRVTKMLRGMLSTRECSAANIATALGVHERTLQRRLHDEGSSFEKIKDEVRREQAESLLAQPGIPLSSVAAMLDYADASTFTRSVRRWFGESPTAIRKRLSATARAAPPPPRPSTASRVNSLQAALKAKRALE